MTADEQSLKNLYARLEIVLGRDEAETLMQLLLRTTDVERYRRQTSLS